MNESMRWHNSRTIWSGIAAIIAGVGQIIGVNVDQQELSDGLLAVSGPVGAIAGALAVWFRAKAEKKVF